MKTILPITQAIGIALLQIESFTPTHLERAAKMLDKISGDAHTFDVLADSLRDLAKAKKADSIAPQSVFIVIQHMHDTQGAVNIFSVRTSKVDAEADKLLAQQDTHGGYLSWVEVTEVKVT